jgi:hypothetical protein
MLKSLLQSPPAALRQGIAGTAVDHVVNVDVLAPVTPAALRQGIARTAVDHVVNVEVLAPVTTRDPQTGNREDSSQPCSLC